MARKDNQFIASIAFHPGETLQEKLIEMNISIDDFAKSIARSKMDIIDIIDGNSSITEDVAKVFEVATKIPAHFWLNQQRSYDKFMFSNKESKIRNEDLHWSNEITATCLG